MPYFTLAELRAQDTALADTGAFPDAELEEMRDLVEESIEHAARVAFVPRTVTETVPASLTPDLFVSHRKVRSLTAATIDGVTLGVSAVTPRGLRRFYRPESWWAIDGQVTVTYEHGYTAPPLRVKRAALILAKTWLLSGPVDDRATQIPTGDGGAINLSTPGVFGATFGIPEVDAVIRQYGFNDSPV